MSQIEHEEIMFENMIKQILLLYNHGLITHKQALRSLRKRGVNADYAVEILETSIFRLMYND